MATRFIKKGLDESRKRSKRNKQSSFNERRNWVDDEIRKSRCDDNNKIIDLLLKNQVEVMFCER